MDSQNVRKKRGKNTLQHVCYHIPWGLAECSIDVYSDISREGYIAPPGAITSLLASGMTVTEADAVLLETWEESCSSTIHAHHGLQLLTSTAKLSGNQMIVSLLASNVCCNVWNVCETHLPKRQENQLWMWKMVRIVLL